MLKLEPKNAEHPQKAFLLGLVVFPVMEILLYNIRKDLCVFIHGYHDAA